MPDLLDRFVYRAAAGTRFSWYLAQKLLAERLVKPTTYMNESGRAVAASLSWLKLEPSDLLVIVDDVALPLGQIRLRPDGSSGGHNGLKSIETHLGTGAYARLRCGVDAVPPGWPLERWVLSRFRPEEEDTLLGMIRTARQAIEKRLGSSARPTPPLMPPVSARER